MDEGSDSRFFTIFKKVFGTNEQQIEEHILDAKADGELESEEVSMLLNVLELDEKQVKEIMVPRTDMVCAELGSSVKDIATLIATQGAHSRIPIFKETKDHILGLVHAKDLLEPLLLGLDNTPVDTLMRPPFFVHVEEPLDEVLAALKRERLHIAIVQDEYGGTSGMVTMEDVLEEIVGEIADEYDQERPIEIQEFPDGSYIVSGRVPLDEIGERCSLDLESEEVDSIGGYIADMAGHIPKQGEFYTFDNRRFTVLEADDRQIWSIKIEPLAHE
ncbi:CBS domain-containing protein [Pseudodesulfovibrio sp. JC047]|uniref:hemolysin family protein n=1 Tax=Pseudodesulfovibrio sp. JC047 TaxID=2683199 RepID=UPI0013D3D9C7|nr:hemolysin family protein [Pseudodesulfovibrio sp. JC047]NDV19186.1 CBS domain-containing protein [Pseudodesulfovibrio sp. JC047]